MGYQMLPAKWMAPPRLVALAVVFQIPGLCSGAGASAASSEAFLPSGVLEFRVVPGRIPANVAVDGPLLGNGDMKVALGGKPESQRFFLGKNDLWRLQHGYRNGVPVGFGELVLEVPDLAGAEYLVRQPLDHPQTEAEFRKDGLTVRQQTMVAADRNVMWIHLEAEGRAVEVRLTLKVAADRGSESKARFHDGQLFGQRSFGKDLVDIPTGVAVALKALGTEIAPAAKSSDAKTIAAGSFLLKPGQPVDLVLTMDSLHDSPAYATRVTEALAEVDRAALPGIAKAHADWWTAYWNRSWIEIGDPALELAYYRGLYGMAACSRNPRFPPGIFGWETTSNPNWHGDYHLNYNHYAPFYGLYSANRIAQADPQDTPILDFVERGRWYAENVTKTRGVLFPVGIGPAGIETTNGSPKYGRGPNAELGGLFFQQRSNAAYALVNLAQRWRTTYDPAYGKKIYPLVKDVADFWEDYLKFEKGRYVIYGDAVHEGSGQDKNSILSLGLVRNALDLALDLSQELEVDADRREKWEHILTHLSTWTTQEKDGKEVFRYTEEGTAWWRNNTLGIQHIYPGNALGLDSDPKWREVAHNTIGVMGRWRDGNGTNSFFPAAVRVGYDPQVILEQLRRYADSKWPNGFIKGNPHGIENLSTAPNTLNEMLCMSHVPVDDPERAESVLRLFPVWSRECGNARFHNIRTWGAFLVSAELKDGEVQSVQITSEKGRPCTMVNPWPGSSVKLVRGKDVAVMKGERITFKTKAGETILATKNQ